jgi:ATP-dependent DNA helicase PIF1
VKGATSYENLRTVDGQLLPDYKGATEARGLIEHENESRECFEEAASYKTGRQLRDLFGQLLLLSNPGEMNCVTTYCAASDKNIHAGVKMNLSHC